MIGRSKWQVHPGAGEACLISIQNDVSLWQKNGHFLDMLKTDAGSQQLEASIFSTVAVEDALMDGSLATASALLDDRGRESVIEGAILNLALGKLENLKKGTELVDSRQSRARVAVNEPGATAITLLGDSVHGYFRRREREVAPGEVFEGLVQDFTTAPTAGGRLEIDRLVGSLILRGLVDKESNQPRVELDIFRK